ncbi:transglutaminase domain-containing protein [Aestuariivivens insulae]|uniref:transglutaminase domain-containing protein n=1 Tax=Aestuariivivens insulae TaxID=1621988 RepID=UPI001F5A3EB9|nr:transglutaminase domain-containing protein [Aestuariivivens insulae]
MKHYLYAFVFLVSLFVKAQPSDFKHIDFKKADSIAHALHHASLNNLPFLAHKLTSNLNTQVEQFRAIHTWVCDNIEADHYFGEKTIRKRKKFKNDSIAFATWNKEALTGLFKRLLEDKKTICSGYAYIIKELSSLVGITCQVIDGYSRTVNTNLHELEIPNHSWNAVKLNDKWYLVDATLASGFYFINEAQFVKDYNDGYFLAAPQLFAKNHYPLDKAWLLTDDGTPTINQFVEGPLIYGKTYKHNVIPMAPKTMIIQVLTGEEVEFSLKVTDRNQIDTMGLIVSSGFKYDAFKASKTHDNNGLLKFNYRFTKKGRYDVHIKVDKDVVASYTVEVEKPKKDLL